MKTAVSHMSRLLAYILTTMILFTTSAFVQGATRIASKSGDWSNTATWGGANVPRNNDDVIINNGITLTVNTTNATCKSITINAGTNKGIANLLFNPISNVTVSGTVTIGGTVSGCSGTIDMASGGTLECNNFALGTGGGQLTSGKGTISLNATNTLPLGVFYNLIIKNGTTTLSRNIFVYGDLTFGLSGTEGTIDQSASNFSIDLYGDMINNNTSAQNFASRNGNINCKGGSGGYGKTDQHINTNGQIYNLDINKPSGTVYYQGTDFHPYGSVSITSGSLSLVAATQFTVEGNLTITGTLDLPSTLVFPLMIIIPPVRGALTLSSNSTLNIRGNSDYAFPYSANTIMDPTSTVNYCFMGNQYIAGLFLTYGNLKLSGSGIKHLHFPTNVKGNITTESPAYFDAVTYSTTITLNGTSPQTITNARFYNLVVNNSYLGNSITLNSTDSVAHQLTCTNGIIDATSYPLLFEAAATVTGASNASHVKGIVKKITNLNESFNFPVGDGTFYRPIGIVTPSANTWTASYSSNSFTNTTAIKPSDTIINHVSDIEYWDLSPQTAGSAKIKLSWADMSKATNPANLLIAHWSSSNSYWENVGLVTIDTGNKTLTSNNSWSSFSPFTLGSNSNDGSLPVELIEFKAHKR